jgi:hypothetical protein
LRVKTRRKTVVNPSETNVNSANCARPTIAAALQLPACFITAACKTRRVLRENVGPPERVQNPRV